MRGMNVLATLKSNKDPFALIGLGAYYLYHARTGFTLSHDEIMVALLVLATVRGVIERFETRLLAAIARRKVQPSEEASSDT